MAREQKKGNTQMVVTILGCGTSVGVPMIGHELPHHRNPKNQRLRTSCLIEPFGRGKAAILIDTCPDLRQQALRYFVKKNPRLDAVLLTHEHADHLHGLDDIRPFNFLQKKPIPFYMEKRTLTIIAERFPYVFTPTQIGGGIPQLTLHEIHSGPFFLSLDYRGGEKKIRIIPLPLLHGKISCMGFRIGSMAYITDCSEIPESTIERLQDLDLLILDCLRPKPHPTHLHIEKSIDYATRIRAKKTIFTHMGIEIEYESFRKSLSKISKRMIPAHDGLQVRIRTNWEDL